MIIVVSTHGKNTPSYDFLNRDMKNNDIDRFGYHIIYYCNILM